MKRIETVFFDMGGTLETLTYDDGLRRQAAGELLDFLRGRSVDPGCESDAFYEGVTQGLAEYRNWNSQSLVELPAERICSEYILRRFDIPQEQMRAISDEFMFLLESRFYDRQVRPEAESVLMALRERGLRLGIISNVMSRSCVSENLGRYGLADYFEVVVASSVYGRRKPDPRIFLYAAQQIGSAPEKCAHIGDKISRDILGARRAGFGLAVRIEHPSVDGPEPRGPIPDAVVSSLDGLLNELERRQQASIIVPSVVPGGNCVKAILFDAGNILYFRPRKKERLARFLESLHLEPGPFLAEERKVIKEKAMIGEVSKRTYQEVYLRGLGVKDGRLLAQAIALLEEDSNDVAFFEGARETLVELKRRGYLLGVITDTYHSHATKLVWLRKNGMDDVWDAFISSCEEGVRKPDPRIYHAALERLSLSPEEAVFVGHKKSELDGAHAVGLKTVAFNYENGVEADHYIEHFSELMSLFPFPLSGRKEEA